MLHSYFKIASKLVEKDNSLFAAILKIDGEYVVMASNKESDILNYNKSTNNLLRTSTPEMVCKTETREEALDCADRYLSKGAKIMIKQCAYCVWAW